MMESFLWTGERFRNTSSAAPVRPSYLRQLHPGAQEAEGERAGDLQPPCASGRQGEEELVRLQVMVSVFVSTLLTITAIMWCVLFERWRKAAWMKTSSRSSVATGNTWRKQ